MKNTLLKTRFSFGFIASFLLLFAVSFVFFSCTDSENENKPHYDTCRLIGTIKLPEEFTGTGAGSRAAVPDLSNYIYRVTVHNVTLYRDEESPQVIDGKFEVALSTGYQYYIKCELGYFKENNSNVYFSYFMNAQSENFTLPVEESGVFYMDFNLVPPAQTSFGTCDLTMHVPDCVRYAKMSNISSKNGHTLVENQLDAKGDAGSRIITYEGSSFNSDTYEVCIKFYGANSTLLYSTNQILYIYNSGCTSRWVSGNTTDGPINADGEFILTQAMIDRYKRTTFYVGAGSLSGVTASNSNEGTPYSPFATVEGAVNAIIARNDPDADYTIYINGEISTASTTVCSLPADLNDKAHSITLSGLNGSSSDSLLLTGTTAGSNPVVYILCTVPVTIKNLKIGRKAKLSSNPNSASASGIKALSGSYVIMEEGTLVTLNYAMNGGGVNNAGTFIMKGGEIFLNTTTTSTSSGAGVYNTGVFSMEGGVIKGNGFYSSSVSGGGVYNNGENARFYMSGNAVIGDNTKASPASNADDCYSNKASNGGGIYNKDKAKIYLGYKYDKDAPDTPIVSNLNGGIYYNYGINSGGGIFNNLGEIYILSGVVSLNYAGSGGGGAVYNNFGSGSTRSIIEMKGGTVTNNAANLSGEDVIKGGIYCYQYNWARSGDYLTLSGFSIGGTAYCPMTSDFDYIYIIYSAASQKSSLMLNDVLNLPEGVTTAATIATDKGKYSTDWQVLTGELTYRNSEYKKIAVKPEIVDGVTTNWEIDPTGYLKKSE